VLLHYESGLVVEDFQLLLVRAAESQAVLAWVELAVLL
jgi:hypothetical protein